MAIGAGIVKTGRYLRWYANGSAVGITRMKALKPDLQQGLEKVIEAGNPDVVEYVKKVAETTLTLDYNVINYSSLALALGQTIASGTSGSAGEVPSLPDNFDIVERMITPGTEGTASETYMGFVVYQQIMVEKEAWDSEVDKLLAVNISAKCRKPRRFVGINGIQFDKFSGNASTTAFTLTQKVPRTNSDGNYTIRVETPFSTVLREAVDFTVASTTSTTTLNFGVAPASSSTPNILAIYAY